MIKLFTRSMRWLRKSRTQPRYIAKLFMRYDDWGRPEDNR